MADTAYRKLGRNGSLGFLQRARSFSSFIILIFAVTFFFVFYFYLNCSKELQNIKDDFEELTAHHLKLKNDLLDAKVKLESLKTDESEFKKTKDELVEKVQACQKKLVQKDSNQMQMNQQKNLCAKTVIDLQTQLDIAKKHFKIDNQNNQSVIANLTGTVEQLRKKLELVHSVPLPANSATNQSQDTGNKALFKEKTTLSQPLDLVKPLTHEENADEPERSLGTGDTAHEQADTAGDQQPPGPNADGAHEKQSADFMPIRRNPGGRVHLEEMAARRDKLTNNKELLNMAAKLDKQREAEEEAKDGLAVPGANEDGVMNNNRDEDAVVGNEKSIAQRPAFAVRDKLGEKDDQVEFKEEPQRT